MGQLTRVGTGTRDSTHLLNPDSNKTIMMLKAGCLLDYPIVFSVTLNLLQERDTIILLRNSGGCCARTEVLVAKSVRFKQPLCDVSC